MLRADRFSHRARIHASRRYCRLGEAIAWHSGLRARVGWMVRRWLASPAHRGLLLSHASGTWAPGSAAAGSGA